jgi:hypothetical protein
MLSVIASHALMNTHTTYNTPPIHASIDVLIVCVSMSLWLLLLLLSFWATDASLVVHRVRPTTATDSVYEQWHFVLSTNTPPVRLRVDACVFPVPAQSYALRVTETCVLRPPVGGPGTVLRVFGSVLEHTSPQLFHWQWDNRSCIGEQDSHRLRLTCDTEPSVVQLVHRVKSTRFSLELRASMQAVAIRNAFGDELNLALPRPPSRVTLTLASPRQELGDYQLHNLQLQDASGALTHADWPALLTWAEDASACQADALYGWTARDRWSRHNDGWTLTLVMWELASCMNSEAVQPVSQQSWSSMVTAEFETGDTRSWHVQLDAPLEESGAPTLTQPAVWEV